MEKVFIFSFWKNQSSSVVDSPTMLDLRLEIKFGYMFPLCT